MFDNNFPELNKFYVTVMFPYPSGSGLHCGHWYNYALADSYCRYLNYIGVDVFSHLVMIHLGSLLKIMQSLSEEILKM